MKKYKSFLQFLFIALLIISTFISIRYSNFPLLFPNDWGISKIFLRPLRRDDVLLSLSTGYIISALFYILMVFIPERRKLLKYTKLVKNELLCVCNECLNLLVSMYKSVCTEEEWKTINISNDFEFFDNNFYSRITRFDAYLSADTMRFKQNDNNELFPFSWDDKLNESLTYIDSTLDTIIIRYANLIDENLLEQIVNLKNNLFSGAYLGLLSINYFPIYSNLSGNKFSERISLYHFRKDPAGKKTPLFSSLETDNTAMLKDFISKLYPIWKSCEKIEQFAKNRFINSYINQNVGNLNSAVFKPANYLINKTGKTAINTKSQKKKKDKKK